MDGWLKALIAAACGVVIAGGAYFAWGEWQAHVNAVTYQQSLESSRAELFRLAKAERTDPEKVRSFCRVVRDYPNAVTGETFRDQVLTTCRTLGYM